MKRRHFLKTTSLSLTGVAVASVLPNCTYESKDRPLTSHYMGGFAAPKLDTVRAAFIGVGARGGYHMKFFAELPGTEVVAISDLYEDNVTKWGTIANEIGKGERHQNVKLYHGEEDLWRIMLDEVKPDIVFIATNWKNHAPMATASMEKGAHAFVEVPMAVTLQEMWDIIDTSERTKKHCMMMENVNYSRDELMFLNMCRQGVIGDIIHGEAAYIHELRWQMEEQERGTGSWRTHHYANRNGNLYPTHGLGPVSQYMNLARQDDTFNSIVSYSTQALGRQLDAKKNYPIDHKWNQLDFKGLNELIKLLETDDNNLYNFYNGLETNIEFEDNKINNLFKALAIIGSTS